jgi:hypothetical protein
VSRAVTAAIACLLVFVGRVDAAQTPEDDPHAVQPQRPTVATHAGTVAPGWLEVEAGAERDRYADRSRGGTAPMLFKIGLAPRVQFEFQVPIVRPAGVDTTGVGDVSVDIKWRFAEGAPLFGNVAILPSLKLPTGSADSGTGTGTTDVGLLLISSHTLGPVAMDLNVGYTHRGGNGAATPRNASLWTASFGGPARGWLGWVAEVYGYPATSGPAGTDSIVAFLAGPTAEIRKWLVLDAGVIVPITGPQPRAVYAGVTYNVGRLWTSRGAAGR